MPVEENMHLMRRWFQEVWNDGRIQTVYDLLASDAVARGQRNAETEIRGPKQFAQFVSDIRGAFPDIKLQIEDILGVEDKVVVRWSATMTHSRDALGIPATGKIVRSRGISIATIDKGKIIEGWDSWDQLGMLEQIGAYMHPEATILAKSA